MVDRFTQTIPFTGGCCAVAGALVVRTAAGAAGADAAAAEAGLGAGWAVGAGWAAGARGAVPNVTIDVIFSIVFFGTPALARSAIDAYGRPAMIFFAVAGPTPGRASRSACDAELRFTAAAGAFVCAPFAGAA